jgi:hypothetical protein
LAGNGIGEPIWSSDCWQYYFIFFFGAWLLTSSAASPSQYVSIARKLLYSFRDGVRIEQGRSGSLMARTGNVFRFVRRPPRTATMIGSSFPSTSQALVDVEYTMWSVCHCNERWCRCLKEWIWSVMATEVILTGMD